MPLNIVEIAAIAYGGLRIRPKAAYATRLRYAVALQRTQKFVIFRLIIAVALFIGPIVPSFGQSRVHPTIPAPGARSTSAQLRENLARAASDIEALQKNVTALQMKVARLEALIAGVMNAGTLHDGFIKDDHGTQIIGTDQNPGSFGYPLAMFGASGGQNALVGEVTNDLATPHFSFPTGITGYGKEASRGNHAFGVYGLGELTSTKGGVAIGAEFTARNLSGHAPDANLPPHTGIGTTTNVVTGINDTCGVQAGTDDCSIALYVSNESGLYSQPVFNTAMYLALFRQYGLFIESQPRGKQVSAVVKNNGNGIHLEMRTTGEMQANKEVLNVLDANNVSHASIRQNGDVYAKSLVVSDAVQLTKITTAALPDCGPSSEGWEYAVTDSNSSAFNAAFTGGGSNHIIGYCNATRWVVH
jgi:hypothetical protein